MPIEFNCQQCRYRLRTPDDSASKQSRCPQCGHIQVVPQLGASSHDNVAAGHLAGTGSTEAMRPPPNPFGDAPGSMLGNPYAAPRSGLGSGPDPQAPVLPGLCLIGIAATSCIFLVLAITAGIIAVMDEGLDTDDVIAFVVLGVTLGLQLLILWGGVNMARRRGFYMAMVGAVTAIVPISMCWCLHSPLGIWALIVLTRPGIRAVFASRDE